MRRRRTIATLAISERRRRRASCTQRTLLCQTRLTRCRAHNAVGVEAATSAPTAINTASVNESSVLPPCNMRTQSASTPTRPPTTHTQAAIDSPTSIGRAVRASRVTCAMLSATAFADIAGSVLSLGPAVAGPDATTTVCDVVLMPPGASKGTSAASRSAIEAGRSAGSLLIARSITNSSASGIDASSWRGRVGSSVSTWPSTVVGSSPSNGFWPVSARYRIAPTAYTSARRSTLAPRACSGAMYDGVPITMPVWVRVLPAVVCLEMPKSRILATGRPESPTRNTFSGFMSR